MRKEIEEGLVSMASGCSFIIGTSIMHLGGIVAFLAGCVLYFIGYWLMDKYKEMN